jgi:hypothetical protein
MQQPSQQQGFQQVKRFKVTGSKGLQSPGQLTFKCLTEHATEKYSIWDPNMINPKNNTRGYFRRSGDVIPASNGMSYPVDQTKSFNNSTFKELFGNNRRSTVYERKILIGNEEYLCDFPKSVEFGPRGYPGNITGGIQALFNLAKSQGRNPLDMWIMLNKQGQGLGTQYTVIEAGAPQQLAQPQQGYQQPAQPQYQQPTPPMPMQQQGYPPQAQPQQYQNSYAGVNLQQPPQQGQPAQPQQGGYPQQQQLPQQPAQPPLDPVENSVVQKFISAGYKGMNQRDVIITALLKNQNAQKQYITPDRAAWIFENFLK